MTRGGGEDPGDVNIKKYPETYILKNLLALAYNAQNKYEEAIKVLDNAIKNDPNNIFILNNLGLVHSNLGNTKIAEEYLNRAIAIKPLFLDASITLANLKSKMLLQVHDELVFDVENSEKEILQKIVKERNLKLRVLVC